MPSTEKANIQQKFMNKQALQDKIPCLNFPIYLSEKKEKQKQNKTKPRRETKK
jgi:hypothetical protein